MTQDKDMSLMMQRAQDIVATLKLDNVTSTVFGKWKVTLIQIVFFSTSIRRLEGHFNKIELKGKLSHKMGIKS